MHVYTPGVCESHIITGVKPGRDIEIERGGERKWKLRAAKTKLIPRHTCYQFVISVVSHGHVICRCLIVDLQLCFSIRIELINGMSVRVFVRGEKESVSERNGLRVSERERWTELVCLGP